MTGPDKPTKSEGAFRTIGELSGDLNVPQHVLRYWESRFPQLRPVQRAGKRRYYRPEDVTLVRRIHHLLTVEGYTVRGVQQLLGKPTADAAGPAKASEAVAVAPAGSETSGDLPDRRSLQRIRDMLAVALGED